MEKLTLTDVCNYIHTCIENKRNIYLTTEDGFFVSEGLRGYCYYSDYPKVKIYINFPTYGFENGIFITDYTEEEKLEFDRALLAIKRYAQEKIINTIKGV